MRQAFVDEIPDLPVAIGAPLALCSPAALRTEQFVDSRAAAEAEAEEKKVEAPAEAEAEAPAEPEEEKPAEEEKEKKE
jgi:nucleoid-associated protein YgaU